ncbi:17145_t:CDS:2, partial [Racocetra persica]
EEFLCSITSREEKTSTSLEDILKKINDLNELTSPNNQFKLMMKHAAQLYLYVIPRKIIDSRRKQLEVLNEYG